MLYGKTKKVSVPYSTGTDLRKAMISAAIDYLSSPDAVIYDSGTRKYISITDPAVKKQRQGLIKDLKGIIQKNGYIDWDYLENLFGFLAPVNLQGAITYIKSLDAEGSWNLGETYNILVALTLLEPYLRKYLKQHKTLVPRMIEVFQDAVVNQYPVHIK